MTQGNPGSAPMFENATVRVMKLLLMIVIALAVLELCFLLFVNIARLIRTGFAGVANVGDLQAQVQRAFGGFLLVILGLELLDTLRTFFTEHRIRLQIIMIVAIIAITRHVILLDVGHLDGVMLTGIGVLVLSLTSGYFLIRRVETVNSDSPASS